MTTFLGSSVGLTLPGQYTTDARTTLLWRPTDPPPPTAMSSVNIYRTRVSGYGTHDPYGNLITAITASKPLGACKSLEYGYDPYFLRPGAITEYTGGGCGSADYLHSFLFYDPGFGVVTSAWTAAPCRRRTTTGSVDSSASRDRLPTSLARPGETQLDMQLEYTEKADGSHIQIVHVTRGQAPWLETYQYLDGYGRPIPDAA